MTMRHERIILLATIAINLICLMGDSAFSQSRNPSPNSGSAATIEEAVNAGNKLVSAF
jgi:hypothetical protein